MFRSFQAIPFAAPPVGDLRFAAPQPVTPWTEERKASGWEDIKCIQYGFLYDTEPQVKNIIVNTTKMIFFIGRRNRRLSVPQRVYPSKCHCRLMQNIQ